MRTLRILTAASMALGALACATEAPRWIGTAPTAVVWESAPAPPTAAPSAAMTAEEARSIAEAHDAAHTCEATARALYERNQQRGWAVMNQCIRRSDFTDLEGMTSRPWLEHLLAEPELPKLIAHVIAARGGDVQNDLRICRRARVPVFSLKAATAEPDTYQGRLVVVRAAPRGGHKVNGARAVELAETRVMAEPEWVPSGPRTSIATETSTSQRGAAGAGSEGREGWRRSEGQRVEVLHNVSVETGLGILVDVGEEPFLESGTDYVVLLRFDGTREAVRGSVLEETPVATLLGYFEPSSGLFARLSR